jgi:hypothetical protein
MLSRIYPPLRQEKQAVHEMKEHEATRRSRKEGKGGANWPVQAKDTSPKLLFVLPRRFEPGERRGGRERRAIPSPGRFLIVVLVVTPGPVVWLLPEDVAVGGDGGR